MRNWVWLIALAGLFAWQHRYEIQDLLEPPPPLVAPEGFSAVLYATQWCGYCAKTRELFKARNVPYEEVDVEHSREGQAQYVKLGGDGGVPLIVINGKVIRGYNRAAIETALVDMTARPRAIAPNDN
jgi:mycoredoxin